MCRIANPFSHSNYCNSGYYYSNGGCYPYSNWHFWGRWVFAGVVIVVILVVLVGLGCVNTRRRRRQGLAPRYGMGWLGGRKYGQNYQGNYNQGYNQGYNQNYQPPPPQYSQQPMPNQYTGNTFNSNEGYYGNQNEGIALQQPSNSYYPRGGEHGYEPPAGPPPSKIN